ncbi:MAG TPA: FmdB family zinc ribbon protein [Anaerolineales bacterium]|nr:FmdB family zinc ribbon protein [Anaerolineales bacterium]
MPTYPYRCLNCKKRFEIFMTYAEYGSLSVSCPHCGDSNVARRINRVRITRSTDSMLDNLDDPSSLDGLEDDPKAMGQMMRRMGAELGEELGPEFHEVVDRLESGQSPEEIEAALPDLGEPGGGAGGDDLDL